MEGSLDLGRGRRRAWAEQRLESVGMLRPTWGFSSLGAQAFDFPAQ